MFSNTYRLILFATLIFIILFATGNTAFCNKSYPSQPILIVTVKKVGTKNLITKIKLQQGVYKAPNVISGLAKTTRLDITDGDGQIVHQTYFQYPTSITIPMPQPFSLDDNMPSVLPITEPEVSLVAPYIQTGNYLNLYDNSNDTISDTKSLNDVKIEFANRFGNTTSSHINPPPILLGTFNVLIIASGYSSANMNNFVNASNRVKSSLLSFEPFKTYSDKININTYQNSANLGCYTGCNGIDRLLCCDSESVISAAASSGKYYDEIIVIHNTSQYAGSGLREQLDAYKYNSVVTYLAIYDGQWSGNMAVHEFGHSFGNLCDEYSYGTEGYLYSECVNCQSACNIWQSLSGTCQQGCDAKISFFRPEDSVMLSLNINNFNNTSIYAEYMPDGLFKRLNYFLNNSAVKPNDLNITPLLELLLKGNK